MDSNRKGNQLAGQASPYLLQHAENPVHWRPWSAEIFAEARDRDCPILLSIGYAACHWCHVMAHESFENAEIAAQMNASFVNVKVDREERPDVDQIYMTALNAMGEQGGWPLTMFLDAAGRPFWGGTYFPPEPRFGRPGFPDILRAIAKAWNSERGPITKNSEVLGRYLQELSSPAAATSTPDRAQFDQFAAALLNMHDTANGGLQGAPKFPNAPMTETILRAALKREGDAFLPAFLRTMDGLSLGGIYDHVGGGIARYAVDSEWLIPHFEKMLYDNAHYITLLLRAYQLSGNSLYRTRIEETVAWMTRELLLPEGAFASSLDADSEGVEGKYYLWDKDEIQSLLGARAKHFTAAYGVSRQGNFEGANILNRLNSPLLPEEEEKRLRADRKKLLEVRQVRVPPMRDDKILTDWNGYAIRALTLAGFALKRPDWIDVASGAYRFISETVEGDGGLAHSWRDGTAVRPPLASDIASMTNAALELAQVRQENSYLDDAERWLGLLLTDFSDDKGGFYLTSRNADYLPARPRCDTDDPNPSPASQLVEAMARAAALLNEAQWLRRAEELAANLAGATHGHRAGIAGFYNAVDHLRRCRHVKIFSPGTDSAEPFLQVMREDADPTITFEMISDGSTNYFGQALAAIPGQVAAIICAGQTCSAPISDPKIFRSALVEGR